MIDTVSLDKAEALWHFGGVILRVNGSGSLKLQLQSLDNIKTFNLNPITMAATTDKEPFKLANFNTQRAFLKIYTTDINEYFKINRVVNFVRPIYTGYPL